MPASASVLAKRLYVPPYTVEEETMWSPARAMFWMAYVTAAAPVETASAAAPPSREAMRFQNICGRVHQAVINIARLRQGKTACRLFRVFEDIRSSGVNRHGARIGGRIRTFLTHMDLACFKSMVLTHGFYIPIGKLGNK